MDRNVQLCDMGPFLALCINHCLAGPKLIIDRPTSYNWNVAVGGVEQFDSMKVPLQYELQRSMAVSIFFHTFPFPQMVHDVVA